MLPFKVTLTEAISQLKSAKDSPFAVVMQHGSMSVEYYSPIKTDAQQPHLQDEIYVIASGHGHFFRNGETTDCKAGDILFVPAGMIHYFENFSDDFATWVIFYGPEGGEKQPLP